MDVKILNPYLKGLKIVLNSLTLNVERKHVYCNKSPYHCDSIFIISKVSGITQGEIIIGMEKETFILLLESFNASNEVDDNMKISILKELGNMVMGHSLTQYKNSGLLVDFKEIMHSEELGPISDSLKRINSLSIELILNEKFPLNVHFVLGDDYTRCEMYRKIYKVYHSNQFHKSEPNGLKGF